MFDHIGIDTHGRDEPPDEPELTDEQAAELDEIEQKIADKVAEYYRLSGLYPSISGYYRVRK